jgi:hypothetical protein
LTTFIIAIWKNSLTSLATPVFTSFFFFNHGTKAKHDAPSQTVLSQVTHEHNGKESMTFSETDVATCGGGIRKPQPQVPIGASRLTISRTTPKMVCRQQQLVSQDEL